MSRIRRFLKPRELHVDVFFGRDGERMMIEIERPPRVIMVTDRMLRLWDPEAPMLEELGYEMYDRDVAFRGSYYARRPWLWLLRAGVWARYKWYRLLDLTHKRLWHTAPNRDGCWIGWRDLRPGPVPLGWFGRLKALGWHRGEVWIRFPRWVYNLRLLVPVNYKTEREPGPVALYLQFGCPGWKKWPKHHLWKLAHIEVVPWRY